MPVFGAIPRRQDHCQEKSRKYLCVLERRGIKSKWSFPAHLENSTNKKICCWETPLNKRFVLEFNLSLRVILAPFP